MLPGSRQAHRGVAPAATVVLVHPDERRELIAHMLEMDRMITAGTLAAGVGHVIDEPIRAATLRQLVGRHALEGR